MSGFSYPTLKSASSKTTTDWIGDASKEALNFEFIPVEKSIEDTLKHYPKQKVVTI